MRLASAVLAWLDERTELAFGIVMDGTRATPEQYTGRLAMPGFTVLGKIVVLRLAAA